MPTLTVPSFAKINWILKILGKRPDGYHQVETVYQTIDLQDNIVFQALGEPLVEVKVEGRKVAEGENNLVHRAALLLRQKSGVRAGVVATLHKKIPVGAGLGGGSSNAAVTLMALNHLWRCSLPLTALADLGAQLGSDVPFFLWGGTALGSGRGTHIAPLPDLPAPQSLIVFYPHLEVSSKTAYQLADWGTYSGSPSLTKEAVETTMRRLFQGLIADGDQGSFLENDFEGVLFTQYPIMARAREALRKFGCRTILPCGSGSALMALPDRGREQEVVRDVSLGNLGDVFCCHSLSRISYLNIYRKLGIETS